MDSDSNSDNTHRIELLWDSKNEQVIEKWGELCKESSFAHGNKAKRFKILHVFIGIPTMILPVVSAVFSQQLTAQPFLLSMLMLLSGGLAAVGQFFDFSNKSAPHYEFEARYIERVNKTESELCKPSARRVAADVFLEHCLSAFNRLCSSAPPL